jgi:predicted dienelactone hydrolase
MLRSIAIIAAIAFASARAEGADRAKEGPLAVDTADDLTLKDAARKKEVPVKIYHPKTGGPYPVIVFSHGFGGNKDAFGPVGKHWASHGYVVVHPSHADGLGRKGPLKKDEPGADPNPRQPPRAGGLLGGLNDPQKIGDRVADVVLVLDSLDDLPKLVSGLKDKIDKEKVGVGGHSFGAYTAMLVGGVTADLGGEKGKSFGDKRVKCILPISGQGTGQQGLTDMSWAALKVPMMVFTGTLDRGVGGQGVEWKKEPFKYSAPGDKYLVVIDGANHLSFGGGLGARSEETTRCVKLASTGFWDAYLKGSADAKKYLQSDQLPRDTRDKCAFDKK